MSRPDDLSPELRGLGEILPTDIMRLSQFISEVRVITNYPEGVSAEGIIEELSIPGNRYTIITGCDQDSGIPKIEDVNSDLGAMMSIGVVEKRGEEWLLTEEGLSVLHEYDRRSAGRDSW